MSILGRAPQILPAISRPHAPCVECGGPVVRRAGEPNTNFWRRQTCSDPCAHRMRHDVAEKLAALSGRSCGCGRPIVHRAGEDLTNFAKRKTCCEPDCIAARKRAETVDHHRRSMRPQPAMQIDDDLLNYGQGFADMDPEPGDGGKLHAVRPDYQTYGGVGW